MPSSPNRMNNHIQWILRLILACFMISGAKAQDVVEKRLVTSLLNDCAGGMKKSGLEHSKMEVWIKEKINEARIFLAVELKSLILTDSATYYKEVIERLKHLENLKVLGRRDSTIWLNEKEKTYLLVSLLSPSRSDTVFHKLLTIWCSVNDKPQVLVGAQTLFDYKIWLFELLDARFHMETPVFLKIKKTYLYRKAIDLVHSEFSGIIEEREKMRFIIDLVRQSGRDSLIFRIYVARGNELEQNHYSDRTDSMQAYLFEVYQSAVKSGPHNYGANFNLYRFYYNEGAFILKNLDNYSDKELEDKMGEAKRYLKKALYYGKKIGIKE